MQRIEDVSYRRGMQHIEDASYRRGMQRIEDASYRQGNAAHRECQLSVIKALMIQRTWNSGMAERSHRSGTLHR
jgi:site-specific recombinase XerC